MIFQDGDVYGRTVNLASRIASHATAGQVLASEDTVQRASSDDLRFEPLGGAALKGVERPVVVGHSYAGAVITQAARAANVKAVVYIAAAAPDTGETATVFNRLAPPLPSIADFTPIDLPHVGQNPRSHG